MGQAVALFDAQDQILLVSDAREVLPGEATPLRLSGLHVTVRDIEDAVRATCNFTAHRADPEDADQWREMREPTFDGRFLLALLLALACPRTGAAAFRPVLCRFRRAAPSTTGACVPGSATPVSGNPRCVSVRAGTVQAAMPKSRRATIACVSNTRRVVSTDRCIQGVIKPGNIRNLGGWQIARCEKPQEVCLLLTIWCVAARLARRPLRPGYRIARAGRAQASGSSSGAGACTGGAWRMP